MSHKKKAVMAVLAVGIGAWWYSKKRQTAHVPHTVEHVDVSKYLGQWYEIARLPNYFQNKQSTDTTAYYALNSDSTIAVTNRCIDHQGRHKVAKGTAFVQNEGNSRLKVSFLPKKLQWLPCTKGDYWVLRIDADYQTVLVGDRKKKYLWLLARQAKLDETIKQSYLETARQQGYNLKELIFTEHHHKN